MKQFTLKINQDGLNTIMHALECYSRLGCNQFAYVLESHPKFNNLDWEDKREIEEYLRHKIDERNFGIYHEAVAAFNQAFQIKKEIQKNVALADNPIRGHMTNIYDGALKKYDYIPVFIDENGEEIKDAISFEIPKKYRKTFEGYAKMGDYNKMWDAVDKWKIVPEDIRGNKREIAEGFSKVTVYEPYRMTRS